MKPEDEEDETEDSTSPKDNYLTQAEIEKLYGYSDPTSIYDWMKDGRRV